VALRLPQWCAGRSPDDDPGFADLDVIADREGLIGNQAFAVQ
jgi:hypothetical protein